jgi:hypothetical protein
MSEEKIIQHAGKALHAIQDKEKGWRKKVKEFLVEILIIVFAVSITLALHNWNDSLHERRLEREFLTGIKNDLDTGAFSLEENIRFFQPNLDYFNKVRQQLATHQVNAAYLDSNSMRLLNTYYWAFDMGRFEGFKSSGNLRLIENQALLKHLMTMYTINIPFQVQADEQVFDDRRHFFEEHIGSKAAFTVTNARWPTTVASQLVDDPAFRYYIFYYSAFLEEKKAQKQALVKKMKRISAEIAEELNK